MNLRVISIIDDINYDFTKETLIETNAPSIIIEQGLDALATVIENNRLDTTYYLFMKIYIEKQGYYFNKVKATEQYYWR